MIEVRRKQDHQALDRLDQPDLRPIAGLKDGDPGQVEGVGVVRLRRQNPSAKAEGFFGAPGLEGGGRGQGICQGIAGTQVRRRAGGAAQGDIKGAFSTTSPGIIPGAAPGAGERRYFLAFVAGVDRFLPFFCFFIAAPWLPRFAGPIAGSPYLPPRRRFATTP